MDAIDVKILRELQRNTALSMPELAEKVGLSHTPCWRRVKRMESEGIITGKALLLNPEKLGFPISVYAEIVIASHDEETLQSFEDEICRHAEIVECFSMSGDSDFLMRIVVKNVSHYEAFLKRVLLHLPGVGSVNSRFALKPIKLTHDLPLP